MSKSRCLRRGLGLREGPGPRTALPPYSGWGGEGFLPSPPARAKAEQTGPVRSSQDRLTGQTRPAPLRVADGDGMDRHHDARTRQKKPA